MKEQVSTNAKKVAEWVKGISRQIPYAMQLSMNELAFKARTNAKSDISKAFSTPTKFTQSAVQVKKASKNDLSVVIGIGSGVRTGKKGDPRSDYLAPAIKGGLRKQKRIEKGLFQGLNIGGGRMWMPAKGEKLNKFGNIPKARQKAIAKGVVNKGTALHNKKFFAKKKNGRVQAIYERYGRGYKSIKPVAIVFNKATYRKRWEFYAPVKKLYQTEFDKTFHLQWNYLVRKDGLTKKGTMVGTSVTVK